MVRYCNLKTNSNGNIVVKVQIMADEEPGRVTLKRYIDDYLMDIELGCRITNKGTKYSKGTISSIRQSVNKLREFEKSTGKELDFKDVDLKFYREYNAFLMGENYSLNSIGKCIKNLKQILLAAEEDGHPINQGVKSNSFKVHQMAVDSIYLTKEDLDALCKVDLSLHPPCYRQARDIFMIGVWTAQRVSDYNNLRRENVREEIIRRYSESGNYSERAVRTIRITQQKTRKRVAIPCSTRLCEILDKYPDNLPHLYEQRINVLIREIGRLAGLTEPVEITSTKGGRVSSTLIPKWRLIQTHTARRTGATLMYLSGMDVYDICKITGHSSVKNLERYIKASELETVRKITEEYDYFR